MLKSNTSPEDAQRTVTQFVLLEIGDRLYGGDPEETKDQSGRDCWSVPVLLVLPDKERKKVGKILVDAATGKMQITESILSSLTTRAERFASQPAPKTHRTSAA
jgi:hypothetical protein